VAGRGRKPTLQLRGRKSPDTRGEKEKGEVEKKKGTTRLMGKERDIARKKGNTTEKGG